MSPSAYASPDIICHLGATPAGAAAPVNAGDILEIQWTPWPASHLGPVIDYLANCNGPCVSHYLTAEISRLTPNLDQRRQDEAQVLQDR